MGRREVRDGECRAAFQEGKPVSSTTVSEMNNGQVQSKPKPKPHEKSWGD